MVFSYLAVSSAVVLERKHGKEQFLYEKKSGKICLLFYCTCSSTNHNDRRWFILWKAEMWFTHEYWYLMGIGSIKLCKVRGTYSTMDSSSWSFIVYHRHSNWNSIWMYLYCDQFIQVICPVIEIPTFGDEEIEYNLGCMRGTNSRMRSIGGITEGKSFNTSTIVLLASTIHSLYFA